MPAKKKSTTSKKDPCWDGYEKIGMKTKNGKLVPNCVPEKKSKRKEELKGCLNLVYTFCTFCGNVVIFGFAGIQIIK